MYWGLEGATYTNQPTREHGIEAHLERVHSHSGAPSTRSLPRTHPALHRRRDNFGGAHGRQLHVHCLRPSPILPSMAPATCIVRSSVNVRTPIPRPAVAPRQDKGEHGRAPIGPIKRIVCLDQCSANAVTRGVAQSIGHQLSRITRPLPHRGMNGCCAGVVASDAIAVPRRSYVS